MKIKAMLACFVLILLAGCNTLKDENAIAMYASLGRTALQTELSLGVTGLSDTALQSRRKIMGAVTPVTTEVAALAVTYKQQLDDEATRRGLPAAAKMKLAALACHPAT